MLSSIPEWMLSFLVNHIEGVIGYAICVLFPVPWLNAFILSLWKKLLKRNAS